MEGRTASVVRPRHLGWMIALAGLVAMLGFTLSMGQVRAEDPDAQASIDLDLNLGDGTANGTIHGLIDLGFDDAAGYATVNLSLLSGGDADSTTRDLLDPMVDDVDACIFCDDAVSEAHLTGGDVLDGTQADACIIGDCVGGASTGVLHSTIVGGEDSFVEDTTAEICVFADCYPDESAAGRILVDSRDNDVLGDTAADICILGDCSGNGDLDGIVGTIGSDQGVADGTSVDAEICILADCDGAGGETGEQAISNETPPGSGGPTDDDSDIPFGDPVGDPTTGGGDDSTANQDPSGDEQGSSQQQGLPLAGFGPMADMGYALPLTALFLLGAAWVAGAYLIRRHG